ncbi:uncharacterized protein [Miscanthus floridulus]|uniref:uncharacterized protein n=1 Tax=Miscanthus floridulus TaxID=154761 RepID=UPI0034576E2B
MWLQLLTSKDEAVAVIKKFKMRTEGESGKKLRVLRTDRGGEFTSVEFAAYYVDQGVVHHHTVPYSPQQNGVVERQNQTVVGMARSMMKAKEEPPTFVLIERDRNWQQAMLEEMKAIEENETWQLVDPPSGCRPISLKWVYKVNRDELSTIVKHKARLVARGFVQREGIDFEEEELVVVMYVDDLIIIGACTEDIDSFKHEMTACFRMSDLGVLSYYLGIKVR